MVILKFLIPFTLVFNFFYNTLFLKFYYFGKSMVQEKNPLKIAKKKKNKQKTKLNKQ